MVIIFLIHSFQCCLITEINKLNNNIYKASRYTQVPLFNCSFIDIMINYEPNNITAEGIAPNENCFGQH